MKRAWTLRLRRGVWRAAWPGLLMLLLPMCAGTLVNAEEVRVAVAANFAEPMLAIAADFEGESGHKVVPAFGSTGSLYAQIHNGAPFAVFLAADAWRPRLLEQEGLAVPGSRWTYAVGQLALWSAEPGRAATGAAALRNGDVRRLAIANPKTAPYGAAAEEVLQNLGLLNELQPRLVRAQNIGQAFQFTATGNADLGMVALSQILSAGNGNTEGYWLVPQRLYQPLRQQGVLLTRGVSRAAEDLVDYLKSAPVRERIRAFGYALE